MYYITRFVGNKVGIIDTADGVEEFYFNWEIVNFHKKNIKIYGISVFNNKAECTPLQLGKTLSVRELEKRLDAWKKLHNDWEGKPVEYYLAEAKVGTIIEVDYVTEMNSDRTILKKIDLDAWLFQDTANTMNGEVLSNSGAQWALEVACIYCHANRIRIH